MTEVEAPNSEPNEEFDDGKEVFELEMLGGGMERRYRRARPEVEKMPWGTLDASSFPPNLVKAARVSWTRSAFQEHRTGAACAATVRALIEARAPLDLIALATRFPLDEMVHVELCSRMAMELGGGITILHDPTKLVVRPREDLSALVSCAELVVRFFCVGEALSIPMLRGTWKASIHPLPKAVLYTIVKDEAAHGAFGWSFLQWAAPHLDDGDRRLLAEVADETIEKIKEGWQQIKAQPSGPASAVHSLGWMQTDAYLELAQDSMARKVIAPLKKHGIPIRSNHLI